ncbi:MAG: alpha/beta hydrolase [Leptospiraceae bacterium]|nr:alpha/beta hydrolase [Leptospiraceae bacterium]
MKNWIYSLAYNYFLWKRYRYLHKELGFYEKHVNIGNQNIVYQILENSNIPIVCIHGLLDSAASFRKLAFYLKENFSIYLLDIPAFGKSKLPPIKHIYHLDLFARMIYDSFQKLEIKNFILLGHSMGGLLAQHIALLDKKAKRIKKLVLLASGNAPHPRRDEMRKLLFPKTKKELEFLFQHLYSTEKQLPNEFVLNALLHVWNSDSYHYLAENTIAREREIFLSKKISKIQIPILFIFGEKDILTSVHDMNQMYAQVKHGKKFVIPNASHAIHLEFPEEIASYIQDFVYT